MLITHANALTAIIAATEFCIPLVLSAVVIF